MGAHGERINTKIRLRTTTKSDRFSTVSTSSLGTYGQFGVGVAAQIVDSGWVSYLRTDYQKGDNIEGWSVNGGLRYQFVPELVIWAREPIMAKSAIYKGPPLQTIYKWTGFYVGGFLGADWGRTNWNLDTGTIDPHFAGLLGGGEIGYNYQIGKWLFGVQGGAGWTNAQGVRPCPTGFFYNCEINTSWLSTATARVGYAYWDRLLVYTKAGAAVAQDQAEIACNTNARPTIVPLVGCPSQTDSKAKTGWTVGWGSEFGLTHNVSVKSEIMYFDLGGDRYNIGGVATDIQRNGFISTLGLYFRFGG